MPRMAAEIDAVTSPSWISLMRAPDARISSIRSWWRGRSSTIVVMSLGRRPNASAIAWMFSPDRLEQVDRAARARADGHLAHVHVRQLEERPALADRDHRHGAVAAARDDAAALERVEREIDRLAAGADLAVRREAASPPRRRRSRPARGSGISRAPAASPAAASRSAPPGRRARASVRPSARAAFGRHATYCSQRQSAVGRALVALPRSHRLVDRFSHSDPLYLFGARKHELEDGDRSPRRCRCWRSPGTWCACAPPDDVVLDRAGCRRAGRCTSRAAAGRRARRRGP